MNTHTRMRSTLSDVWRAILEDRGPGSPKRITAALEIAVKAVLENLGPGQTMGTTELGETIWPRSVSRHYPDLTKRMFTFLLASPPLLPEWRRRAELPMKNRYGVEAYPWEWFNARHVQQRAVGLASRKASQSTAEDALAQLQLAIELGEYHHDNRTRED